MDVVTETQIDDKNYPCCGRCKKFVPDYPGRILATSGRCSIREGLGNGIKCGFFVIGEANIQSRGYSLYSINPETSVLEYDGEKKHY